MFRNDLIRRLLLEKRKVAGVQREKKKNVLFEKFDVLFKRSYAGAQSEKKKNDLLKRSMSFSKDRMPARNMVRTSQRYNTSARSWKEALTCVRTEIIGNHTKQTMSR